VSSFKKVILWRALVLHSFRPPPPLRSGCLRTACTLPYPALCLCPTPRGRSLYNLMAGSAQVCTMPRYKSPFPFIHSSCTHLATQPKMSPSSLTFPSTFFPSPLPTGSFFNHDSYRTSVMVRRGFFAGRWCRAYAGAIFSSSNVAIRPWGTSVCCASIA